MANKSNASGKSKKNYLNPITDPRDVFNIHYNKNFGSKYIWDLNINTVFHIPTKGAVKEYGKENCWVCIQKGISEAIPDWKDENGIDCSVSGKKSWGRVRYTAKESVVIRYDDFEKAKGIVPILNQGPKPTNWN